MHYLTKTKVSDTLTQTGSAVWSAVCWPDGDSHSGNVVLDALRLLLIMKRFQASVSESNDKF